MKVTFWWRYLSEFLHGQTSETKTNKQWGGLALGGLKSEKTYVICGLKTKILLAHLSKCLCLKKSNSIKLTLSNSTNTIFFFLLLVCSQGKRVKWLAHPETFLKCERDWDLQYHYPKPLLSKSCKLISITWWNESSNGKYPTSK